MPCPLPIRRTVSTSKTVKDWKNELHILRIFGIVKKFVDGYVSFCMVLCGNVLFKPGISTDQNEQKEVGDMRGNTWEGADSFILQSFFIPHGQKDCKKPVDKRILYDLNFAEV